MFKLAIVLPCYNEEEILRSSIERLSQVLLRLVAKEKISADSFMLFVNDGSKDHTWQIIEESHAEKPVLVKGVKLAHNAGHQNAIMAGMTIAKDMSDALITMDADLQDDLNAVEQMVDNFAVGYDIVYGVKVSRQADPFMKRFSAMAFYKLQDMLGAKTIFNHADFRLMSRRAVESLMQYGERNLYLRGIIPLLGYPSAMVDDSISERQAGKSKYTLQKMLNLAMNGVTSFSVKPISMILWMGVAFMFICLLMVIYVLVSFFSGHVVPGWSSLMMSIWFIGSVILIAIGIVGEYIGRIFVEVKHRPLYHIEQVLK
jgi:polyisoprenyl-phosphate glycosyltransferase